MLAWLTNLVSTLNSLTPLGLAGGLGYIIYQLALKNRPILSHLPETLTQRAARLTAEAAEASKQAASATAKTAIDATALLAGALSRLEESSRRQEATLEQIRDGINYMKGRLNGKGSD